MPAASVMGLHALVATSAPWVQNQLVNGRQASSVHGHGCAPRIHKRVVTLCVRKAPHAPVQDAPGFAHCLERDERAAARRSRPSTIATPSSRSWTPRPGACGALRRHGAHPARQDTAGLRRLQGGGRAAACRTACRRRARLRQHGHGRPHVARQQATSRAPHGALGAAAGSRLAPSAAGSACRARAACQRGSARAAGATTATATPSCATCVTAARSTCRPRWPPSTRSARCAPARPLALGLLRAAPRVCAWEGAVAAACCVGVRPTLLSEPACRVARLSESMPRQLMRSSLAAAARVAWIPHRPAVQVKERLLQAQAMSVS